MRHLAVTKQRHELEQHSGAVGMSHGPQDDTNKRLNDVFISKVVGDGKGVSRDMVRKGRTEEEEAGGLRLRGCN